MICAAALAVACAEEPQDEPIVEHPTTKDMTFTTEAATPDSRVLFADGEGLAWENADLTKMAVCYDEAGAWKHTCSTSGAINEGTATFTATVDAESVFAYCYYPYAENSATDATFAYDFAAALTQNEAGRTTALRLASSVIDIEGEVTNVTAQFHNVGSLLRYFIYAAESDEKVESVALEATAPIAGTYTYNLATAEGEVGGTTSNEVTVTLGTALSLEGITAADKAKSVFMPIVPATSEGVTYVVTTDKNVYEFVSDAAHTWAEGAVTEIKLNLAKATNVTPIGGGEPEEPKLQLYYLFREKNGKFGAKEQTLADHKATAIIASDGWFLVGVGGKSDDKLILSNYENEPPYRDLRFECPDWIEYTHNGGQLITLAVKENTTEEQRVGTFKIYSNVDTDIYEVVYADGETITIEDPVYSITLTQPAKSEEPEPDPSDATEIIYKFTFQGMPAINFDIAANGVTDQDLSWYSVIIGGTDTADASKAPFTQWRYVATDSEDNEVDWLSIRHQNNNRLYLSCNANTAEARTATINLYWDDTAEYKVVGTYKQAAPNHQVLEEITTNDPILTLTVNQAAGNGGPSELIYEFTNAWANNPVGSNGGALWPHAYYFDNNASTKGSNGYQVKVDGVVSSNNGADFYQKWTYKAVDVVTGEEVTWVSAAPFSNTINFTVEANSTGAGREAYVHIYWNDNDSYKVVGTHKDWNATYEAIDTTQPIYTATIKQGISYSDIVYEFTTKNVKNHNYNVAAAGVTNPNGQNISWYAAFCNRQDTANGEYFNLSCRAYDATTGEEITWARAGAASNGKNEIVFFCDANDTGAERKAIVNLYWYNTDTYKVVGTYKTASSPNTFTPITDSENEPVLTLTLTQAAQ